MMEEQPQTLPKGWVEKTLGEVVIHQKGKMPKSFSEKPKQGYLSYIDIQAFEEGIIRRYASIEKATITSKNDVLVVWDGARFGLSGMGIEGVLGSTLVRIDSPLLDTRLLYYFIHSKYRIINSRPRGTGTPHVEPSVFWPLRIPIAPLNEQKRIVDKIERLFSDLDKGEENLRQAQRLLSSYRQSVLKAAVTGELTRDWREANKKPLESGEKLLQRILKTRREQWQSRGKYTEPNAPDITNLSPLPKGWVWISPDQISVVFGNGLSKKPAAYETKYPILRISAVRPMAVDTSDIRFYEPHANEKLDNFWVKNGDLLFTRYNGSSHLVGVCGLHRGADVLHPDKIIKSRTVEIDGLSRDYLELCLNVGESRAFIRRNIKTTAGQQGIAGGDLKLAPIPLAPGEEQIEIVDRVRDMLSRISTLEAWCETELKRSATLRQSILKSAFSGQLVPQDAADEPASELLKRIVSECTSAPKAKPASKRGRTRKQEAA